MTRVVIGDLLTGRRIEDLPYLSYRWSRQVATPEQFSVVANMADPDTQALNLRNSATPGKTLISIVEENAGGEWFAAAGGTDVPTYDGDVQGLTLPGAGLAAFFAERNVLPVAALTIDPSLFIIPDPLDATKTIPNPLLGTAISGVDYGTMMKRLLQQMQTWPASAFPIVFGADVVGTYTKSWDGVDFKKVADAITDIANLQAGVEWRLQPRYQSDRRGVEWVHQTGTVGQPKLASMSVWRWTVGAVQGSTKGLKVGYDGSSLGSVSWATGGRSADVALVARASSSMLTDAGYPLREVVDSSHSDVTDVATLLGYAQKNLMANQGAVEQLSFQVRKNEAPYLGQYVEGDFCVITSEGDPFYPDGEHSRRITALSGDQSDWVTITTEAV